MRSNYEMKLSKNNTMPIDGFKEYGTNSNLLVIGSSGSGKTMNIVLPMLLDDFKEEPVTFVVQDCKGTLYRNLSKKFIDEGYEVRVLDFVNPRHSNVFNPFDYIFSFDDARKIVDSLASSSVASLSDHFWETSAKDLICNLIMYMKHEYSPDLFNISFLSELVGLFSKDYSIVNNVKDRNWLVEMKINRDNKVTEKYTDKNKVPTVFYKRLQRMNERRKIDYFVNLETYYQYPSGTFSSIIAEAKALLSPYVGEDISKIITGPDQMNLHDLGNTKTIIFVNPSDVYRIYDPIVGLFYSTCLQCVINGADKSKDGRLRYPFRFILDDFASGTKINDFDKAISNIRSRNVSCTLIIQSMSQLTTLYGQTGAQTIISNCSSQIYLGSNDLDQELDISRRLNTSYEKIHELDRKKLIIISENKRPIIDYKFDYKDHPNFKLCGIYDLKNQKDFREVQMYAKEEKLRAHSIKEDKQNDNVKSDNV